MRQKIRFLLLPMLFACCTAGAQYFPDTKPLVRRAPTPFQHKGYSNVLTFHFPQLHVVNGLRGLATGFGYERFLDRAGRWSIGIPLHYLQATNGSSEDLHGIGSYESGYGWYSIPGVHYHLFGNMGRNDLSIGLASMLGFFTVTDHQDKYGLRSAYKGESSGLAGLMGQLIYRLHITNHFIAGLELGYGRSFVRNFGDHPVGGQLGLRLGGRF